MGVSSRSTLNIIQGLCKCWCGAGGTAALLLMWSSGEAQNSSLGCVEPRTAVMRLEGLGLESGIKNEYLV